MYVAASEFLTVAQSTCGALLVRTRLMRVVLGDSNCGKTVRPTLSDRCLSLLSVLSVTLVYCGRTVGWIRIPLGMEVGLGPGHIVLYGNPALPPRGTVRLCDFRHISTSGFGVGASRASFIAIFAISCTRYRVYRPLRSRLSLNNTRGRYFRF